MINHISKSFFVMSAIALSGCAAYETVPAYQGDSIEFKVNKAETAYFAATSCAMDNISVPASGDFFSYESEKNQSYALTYNFSVNSISPMLPAQNARGTLKVVVKGDDVSIKVSNVNVYYERSDYSSARWGEVVFKEQVKEASSKVGNLLKSMESCIKNHE